METLWLEELKKNPLFQTLETSEITTILGLATRQDYEAGDVVFKEDKEATKLYIVEKGLVAMIKQIKPGTERTIVTETRGGAFGWSALLPPHRTGASAKCREASQLLVIDGARLRELCYQKPELGVKVMEGLARFMASRIYWTNLRLIDAMWT